MKNYYIDNAATTQLSETTINYLNEILNIYGNPSSSHSIGQKSKQLITSSREAVAKFIGANKENIYFTCGGSASNTAAIRGFYRRNDCYIFYSPTLHKSAIKCISDYKNNQPLKVDKKGFIDIADLKKWLETKNIMPFVVIEHANSEIGTIQNIPEIIDLVHKYNGIIYIDCTGSISTIPINVKHIDADMIGFSAHKLGGLKGCGVLYKKQHIELEPLVYGNQENGLIGGTENILGIASLYKIVESYDYSSITSYNRDFVYNYIMNNIQDTYLVGATISDNRLPLNLNVCFRGIQGESLMLLLDLYNIQVSTGSACNNNTDVHSTVLSAIGINDEDKNSCIRMTFSGKETQEDLMYICDKIKLCVEQLRDLKKL